MSSKNSREERMSSRHSNNGTERTLLFLAFKRRCYRQHVQTLYFRRRPIQRFDDLQLWEKFIFLKTDGIIPVFKTKIDPIDFQPCSTMRQEYFTKKVFLLKLWDDVACTGNRIAISNTEKHSDETSRVRQFHIHKHHLHKLWLKNQRPVLRFSLRDTIT